MYIFITCNGKKCAYALYESQIVSHATQFVDLFNSGEDISARENEMKWWPNGDITIVDGADDRNECMHKPKSLIQIGKWTVEFVKGNLISDGWNYSEVYFAHVKSMKQSEWGRGRRFSTAI